VCSSISRLAALCANMFKYPCTTLSLISEPVRNRAMESTGWTITAPQPGNIGPLILILSSIMMMTVSPSSCGKMGIHTCGICFRIVPWASKLPHTRSCKKCLGRGVILTRQQGGLHRLVLIFGPLPCRSTRLFSLFL
jgi:hypothetical protein